MITIPGAGGVINNKVVTLLAARKHEGCPFRLGKNRIPGRVRSTIIGGINAQLLRGFKLRKQIAWMEAS